MAISKNRKRELVAEYNEWLSKSRGVVLAEYQGLSMKDLDALRAKIREVDGEFHIVKNTLCKLAFEEAGLPLPAGFFEGSTAIGVAFRDAPSLAKAMVEFAKGGELLKIKGGYLQTRPLDQNQVRALAELPPLPVMRARLLGTILAPAGQLVRTLAEPGRGLAAVIKAFADQGVAPATA